MALRHFWQKKVFLGGSSVLLFFLPGTWLHLRGPGRAEESKIEMGYDKNPCGAGLAPDCVTDCGRDRLGRNHAEDIEVWLGRVFG